MYSPAYPKDSTTICVDTNDAITRISAAVCGARPYRIIPLDRVQLPKSALGKISRTKIKSAFETGAYDKILQEYSCIIQAHRGSVRNKRILTKTEQAIFSIFVDILELDSKVIGVESNMFEAGITSIELLRMQKVLQNRFAIAEIPLITLLTNPTIEGMSAAVDRSKGPSAIKVVAYDPVVPLSTKGDETPLWLVHSGVGEILVFLNLAKFITDRPVYALRAKGFEQGQELFGSITEIVDTYCQHIRRI